MGIRGGSAVSVCGFAGGGTVGWSFFLNGEPVCITANHVVTDRLDCAVLAGECRLFSGTYEVTVEMVDVVPFKPLPEPNSWDLAVLRYPKADDIEAAMEACVKGANSRYPTRIASDIRDGEDCWTVGQAPPRCSESPVKFVADVEVLVRGDPYRFVSVLGFSDDFAQEGDSGSIAMYKSDNAVAGLLFAKVEPHLAQARSPVYANPLFKAGWKWVSDYATGKGLIPQFEGRARPPSGLP
jgi:hypothetical protein